MNNRSLLIVESPTKVKTIQQYLGDEYDVLSCVGHVKDLPRNDLGIDIDNNFKIQLTILSDKKKFISELRKTNSTFLIGPFESRTSTFSPCTSYVPAGLSECLIVPSVANSDQNGPPPLSSWKWIRFPFRN